MHILEMEEGGKKGRVRIIGGESEADYLEEERTKNRKATAMPLDLNLRMKKKRREKHVHKKTTAQMKREQ